MVITRACQARYGGSIPLTRSHPHRGVEQLAARRAHNPQVPGSSPGPATKKQKIAFIESDFLF